MTACTRHTTDTAQCIVLSCGWGWVVIAFNIRKNFPTFPFYNLASAERILLFSVRVGTGSWLFFSYEIKSWPGHLYERKDDDALASIILPNSFFIQTIPCMWHSSWLFKLVYLRGFQDILSHIANLNYDGSLTSFSEKMNALWNWKIKISAFSYFSIVFALKNGTRTSKYRNITYVTNITSSTWSKSQNG